MEYFNSEYFTYKDKLLYCEDVPLEDIADKFGTPVYIYSKKFLLDRVKEFDEAFRDVKHNIFYACKSNFNLSVIKTLVDAGCGVDVNSEGELFRALKAGTRNDKIIFSGVGKTVEEIKSCLKNNLLMIKAESLQELQLINEAAKSMNIIAPASIRVNPDVDAATHPYISTGLAENKFGINAEQTFKIITENKELTNIKFVSIDMHIGSQITTVAPYTEAVEKLAELYFKLFEKGIKLKHIDLGGGIGIPYKNEKTFKVKELADAIKPVLIKLGCDIFFEPGRFMTANSGILLSRVLYTKNNSHKKFVVVDAAMNDLLRPSIYGSYHHIQPVKITEGRDEIIADIVGPVCESGDFLAKDRKLTGSIQGEYVAVMSAGAYGMPMASNYNARRRPAEVMVDGSNFKLIRSRETFEHLIYDEEKLLDR